MREMLQHPSREMSADSLNDRLRVPSLKTTDLLRSQVCRSSQEILSTHEQWRAAMIEKGWT